MTIWYTLLGGLLASLSGAGVLWLERQGARKDAKLHLDEVRSARALGMIMKISQMHAWNSMIDRYINKCFDDVADPYGSIDPGIKVVTVVIPAIVPDAFDSEEIALAFETNDTGLVEKLLNLSTNFHTNLQTLREFNIARKEHTAFVQQHSSDGSMYDGEMASVTLPAKLKHSQEIRVALLNQLVSALMTSIQADMGTCVDTMQRLRSALVSLHGVRVPTVQLSR